MKGYQIWMECHIENDEDYNDFGHTEHRRYSSTVYLDKNEAEKIMNGIDKRHALLTCGLSASYCKKLYLREVEIK